MAGQRPPHPQILAVYMCNDDILNVYYDQKVSQTWEHMYFYPLVQL